MYKSYFKEADKTSVNDIASTVSKGNHYIFSSFNDPRITKVEDLLDKKKVKYITTSQSGNDYVIAGNKSPYFKKHESFQECDCESCSHELDEDQKRCDELGRERGRKYKYDGGTCELTSCGSKEIWNDDKTRCVKKESKRK